MYKAEIYWGIDFSDGEKPHCLEKDKSMVLSHAKWFRKVFNIGGESVCRFNVVKVLVFWWI